jgi:hypothetical protein
MTEKEISFTVKEMSNKQIEDELDRLRAKGFTRTIKKSRLPKPKKKKETKEERQDFLAGLLEMEGDE